MKTLVDGKRCWELGDGFPKEFHHGDLGTGAASAARAAARVGAERLSTAVVTGRVRRGAS